MKNLKGLSFLIVAAVILSISLMGCGENKSGNTINEPDEITVEYLEEEYANQLKTDNAVIMIGSVTLEKNNDIYTAHIIEKEVVPSSDNDEGYYIADTNITKDVALGAGARITYIADDGESVVTTADKFIKQSNNDEERIYTIYLMGESAELILATAPEDVMVE